jgi:hypothetical protein
MLWVMGRATEDGNRELKQDNAQHQRLQVNFATPLARTNSPLQCHVSLRCMAIAP